MAEMFDTRKKVFLGGTCNGDQWRERLKPMLDAAGIKYFDPVVPEWNPEAQARELKERDVCDFCLYVITPRLKGTFSVAEAVEDAVKRPAKCVFAVLSDLEATDQWEPHVLKSLMQVGAMVERNGGAFLRTLSAVADYLKKRAEPDYYHTPQVGERYFAIELGVAEVVAVGKDNGPNRFPATSLVTLRASSNNECFVFPEAAFRYSGATFDIGNGGYKFRRLV